MGEPDLSNLAAAGGGLAAGSLRLHIGCGEERLAGWLNVDIQPLPGVDLVADVTRGLDLPDGVAAAIFAEHFLEHLSLDHAVAFLREAHRLLAPGRSVRLSTPNLDWVLATHYPPTGAPNDRVGHALQLNRAFHGWSHRCLWNRELLEATLLACGFVDLRWPDPGASELAAFRGIDRHERYADSPALPHVLLVEATRGEAQPQRLAAFLAEVEAEHLRFVRSPILALDWQRSRLTARWPARGAMAFLLREHVLEATLVGGSVRFPPEAPEAARFEIVVDLRHLVVDDPQARRRLGLLPIPLRFRERLLERLREPAGLDIEEFPRVSFVATGARRVGPGRYFVEGDLRWRDRSVRLGLELTVSEESGAWRATSSFQLPLAELCAARDRGAVRSRSESDRAFFELLILARASPPT